MKKFAAIAVFGFCVSYLSAQVPDAQVQTQTETKTTTINGTLVDQGCYTTRTQTKETNGMSTTETSKIETECPVTTTTTSFGIMTPEGKFVRFDDAGNTRVVEMVKSNKEWHTLFTEHKPVRVRVVGTPNGDTIVIREIK